ncbi:hypothetical protein Tco_0746246 [Tanacetum coccineum]
MSRHIKRGRDTEIPQSSGPPDKGSPSSAIFEECVSPLVDGLFQFKDIMLLFLLMAREIAEHVVERANAEFRQQEPVEPRVSLEKACSDNNDGVQIMLTTKTRGGNQLSCVQIHLLLPVAFHQLKHNATSTNIHFYGRYLFCL